MSTLFLRGLVEAGFCGRKAHETKFQDTVGYVHYVLDRCVAMGKTGELSSDEGRAAVSGRYGIPYANQPQFGAWAKGLAEKLDELTKEVGWDAEEEKYEIEGGDSVVYVWVHSGCSSSIIELSYQYFVPDHYIPMHSLAIAHLKGLDQVTIRVIPVLANKFIQFIRTWAVDHDYFSQTLNNIGEGSTNGGFQCIGCPHRCNPSATDFDKLCVEWLEAKEAAEEKEARLKEFLAFRGPTKCGNYIVFLKEHARRFFRDKDFPGFLAMIMSEHPKDYLKFLSPDAAEIAKAVEQKLLPESVMAFFKESRYTTIESGLTI